MIKTKINAVWQNNFRFITVLAAFLILTAGICGMAWWFFPIEFSEFYERLELWGDGVKDTWIGGDLHVYTKDSCPKESLGGGPGCTCVALVHGLGDNALTWKKVLLTHSDIWRKVGLHQPIRLFAVDLPGAGGTPPPQDLKDYSVRRQAERLRPRLASVCQKWVVAGNSYGGWIASWLALDWPEGVSRLILLDSAGLKKMRTEVLNVPSSLADLKEFYRKAYYQPREIPDALWAAIFRKLKASPVSQIMQAQNETDDIDLRLSTLEMPTYMLWGKQDQVLPLQVGYQLRALVPSAIWTEVDHCGHLPQKECPEMVVKSIVDMINYGAF